MNKSLRTDVMQLRKWGCDYQFVFTLRSLKPVKLVAGARPIRDLKSVLYKRNSLILSITPIIINLIFLLMLCISLIFTVKLSNILFPYHKPYYMIIDFYYLHPTHYSYVFYLSPPFLIV